MYQITSHDLTIHFYEKDPCQVLMEDGRLIAVRFRFDDPATASEFVAAIEMADMDYARQVADGSTAVTSEDLPELDGIHVMNHLMDLMEEVSHESV